MTTTHSPARKRRRMAREPQATFHCQASPKKDGPSIGKAPEPPRPPSRLDQLAELLSRESGASIAEMMEQTGWQQHSVRGAMAGALKKRGLSITSDKVGGSRRYRATRESV